MLSGYTNVTAMNCLTRVYFCADLLRLEYTHTHYSSCSGLWVCDSVYLTILLQHQQQRLDLNMR